MLDDRTIFRNRARSMSRPRKHPAAIENTYNIIRVFAMKLIAKHVTRIVDAKITKSSYYSAAPREESRRRVSCSRGTIRERQGEIKTAKRPRFVDRFVRHNGRRENDNNNNYYNLTNAFIHASHSCTLSLSNHIQRETRQ